MYAIFEDVHRTYRGSKPKSPGSLQCKSNSNSTMKVQTLASVLAGVLAVAQGAG